MVLAWLRYGRFPILLKLSLRLKLGVFTFFAFKAVHYGLVSIYGFTETHEEPKRAGVRTVSQETEDGRSPFPHLLE